MISFIVIGKNEGWKLNNCFQSIEDTIDQNELFDSEIIYIDSKSTDDSINRAKIFNKVIIYRLDEDTNPAIARNLGALKSQGDILFFIDGDMQILPDFLPLVLNSNKELLFPFVSGQLKNYNYDQNGVFLNNSWQYKGVLNDAKYFSTTGGIFIINKELWINIDGMDVRFRRGEDLDLGLRLAKKGYKILRKKEIIAYHHTVSYTHTSRLWDTLFSGDTSYSNSFLFRKHLFNIKVYGNMIKTNYTLIALILISICSIIIQELYLFLIYFLVILLKILKQRKKTIKGTFELILFYPIRDLLFIFFFAVPLKKLNSIKIEYTKIN